MEGLRVQDIIGLILAILIVAILISIILILRESSREKRMWQQDDYDEYEETKKPRSRMNLERKQGVKFSRPSASVPSQKKEETPTSELETKRKWGRIPRERDFPREQEQAREGEKTVQERRPLWKRTTGDEEVVIEKVTPRPSHPTQPPEKEEAVSPPPPQWEKEEEKEVPSRVPLEEERPHREPRQAVLERALKKLQETGIEIRALKVGLGEENIDFSPLLWEAREEVKAGKNIGDIVIHTVFKNIPGRSGEDVVELYRSGDVSVVDRLEAKVRTAEGRDYLVASLYLSHFRIPELSRLTRNGTLTEEELEVLAALKFVDRSTKKDFARAVYSRIMNE